MYEKKNLEELCKKQRKEIDITRELITTTRVRAVCTLLVARDVETIGMCQDTLRKLCEQEELLNRSEENLEYAERFLKTL